MEKVQEQEKVAAKVKAPSDSRQLRFTPVNIIEPPFSCLSLMTAVQSDVNGKQHVPQPAMPSMEPGKKSQGYLRRGNKKSWA
ncbi:MAG: hypothetical protein M0Q95_06775 [Porticoccaceae bacterium]|nr:hypothetical protein [Porticoccaceae bacterium]